MSSPRAISELDHHAVVPVDRPRAARRPSWSESTGPRSKKAISFGCAASVQSNTEMPPWYHACTITSRPGDRDQRAVVGHAVLLRRLRRRQLVVALELQLAVREREDRVGAPLLRIGRAALGLAAAAPLVGEQELGAVVVEGGRVPVGEVRVGHGGDPLRVGRIADVEQQAVALAGAAGQTDRGIERDVVALRSGPAFGAGVGPSACAIIAGSACAQRGAVRGRRRARAAARLHGAVEQRVAVLLWPGSRPCPWIAR